MSPAIAPAPFPVEVGLIATQMRPRAAMMRRTPMMAKMRESMLEFLQATGYDPLGGFVCGELDTGHTRLNASGVGCGIGVSGDYDANLAGQRVHYGIFGFEVHTDKNGRDFIRSQAHIASISTETAKEYRTKSEHNALFF
jgi:hypothetical protein